MKTNANILAVGLLSLFALAQQPVVAEEAPITDAQLLTQLAKTSPDLKKLHEFDFSLRFPSKAAAQAAVLKLIGLAFEVNSEPGKVGNDWVLHASKVMYPVETDLSGLRDKLDTIAKEGHGTYDGWQAKVATAPKAAK